MLFRNPWLRTEDIFKEKTPCQSNLFMLSKVRFPTKLNKCRLKILVPKIIIYYGKKRGVACSIYTTCTCTVGGQKC